MANFSKNIPRIDINRDRYVDSEGVGGREASIDKTERLSNRDRYVDLMRNRGIY